MIVLPVPSLLYPPVLAELRQADQIASEDYERMSKEALYLSVQCCMPLEEVVKIAGDLRRNGSEKVCKHLAGMYVCTYTMQ